MLNKLYGNTYPSSPVNLEHAVESVYSCIRKTVVQRRGHQCILLGARGTGKSLSVQHALEKATKQFPNQFIVVHVNGLVHGEDRLALREIAKQLDQQIHTGDDPIEKPSMSHTLKTLNVLFDVVESEVVDGEESQQQENAKSVIFIVDELDRYATAHQVLAYELFDWCQASLAGVAVIGTSARINVMDLLEKRNRSRNTAQVISLGKPNSPQELEQIGHELLSSPSPTSGFDEYCNSLGLPELAEHVFYTSNSARHLAGLLVPRVLGITQDVTQQQLTSERLLLPLECVPELDLALAVCAARALVRYNTQTVNLVIVLDEWRALADTTHSIRFAAATSSKPVPKPGSTPASLRAVRHAWERLQNMGLLEPGTAQSTQEDLKMFVPELDLDDLRGLLPKHHALYEWTSI